MRAMRDVFSRPVYASVMVLASWNAFQVAKEEVNRIWL
jgi:hypothetical protein